VTQYQIETPNAELYRRQYLRSILGHSAAAAALTVFLLVVMILCG
jgi:hypothetical protein